MILVPVEVEESTNIVVGVMHRYIDIYVQNGNFRKDLYNSDWSLELFLLRSE